MGRIEMNENATIERFDMVDVTPPGVRYKEFVAGDRHIHLVFVYAGTRYTIKATNPEVLHAEH